jgi:cytoskeletal protein CcmA (bactofilin family)
MIKAQDQFAVTTEGKLFAKNADITGKITTDLLTANGGNIKDITGENITVKSGEFTGTLKATTGTIGNWELNVEITELDAKKRKLSAIRNTNGNAAIEVKCNGKYAGIKSSSGSAFYAGANGPANGGDGKTSTAAFSVSHDGILYASGATITGNSTFKGTLDAAGGTFSGKLDAVDGTFTGTLSGVDGDFTGTITADKLVLGKMEWTSDGWTYTDDKKYDGGGKQCFKFDTPWSAKTYWAKFINGIFWGVVPGDKPSGFTDVAK